MSSTTRFASGQIRARESVAAAPAPRAPVLAGEEADRFLRIVAGSLSITRHCQLLLWLNGELQQFVPHEILISAWATSLGGASSSTWSRACPGCAPRSSRAAVSTAC